ncbi:MAG: hypothetical protein AAFV25_16805 [Bacteroidota bacterium]
MKTSNQLLDDDLQSDWGHLVLNPSDILWRGRPFGSYAPLFLERDFYYDAQSGAIGMLGWMLGIAALIAFLFFGSSSNMALIAVLAITFAMLLVPELVIRHNRRHTYYAFTKDRVLFHVSYQHKTYLRALPFDKIARITYQEEEGGYGVIHFVPIGDPDLESLNLTNGSKRHYPTFEAIKEVRQTWEQLNRIHSQAEVQQGVRKNIAAYRAEEKTAKPLPIRIPTLFLTFLVIGLFAYGIDFYLLPTRTITDRLVSFTEIGVDYDGGTSSRTQKGLTFGVSRPFMSPRYSGELIITHSPIFRSVKDVKYTGISYQHNLTNDLNNMGLYLHSLTFLVFLVSRILLFSEENRANKELVTKVFIASGLFLFYSLFVWYCYG